MDVMRGLHANRIYGNRVFYWGIVLCVMAVLWYAAMAEAYSIGGGPCLISGRHVDVLVPNRCGPAFEFPCDDCDSDVECSCVLCRWKFYRL
jgi:hypothetical protein